MSIPFAPDQRFVDSHLKPSRCQVVGCEDSRFSSGPCLLRHEQEAHAMHRHGEKPYLCTYKGCERSIAGNSFPRNWNLRDHMKRAHNGTGNAGGPNSPSNTRAKKRKTDATRRPSATKALKMSPLHAVEAQPETSFTGRYYQAAQAVDLNQRDMPNCQKEEDSSNLSTTLESFAAICH